MDVPTSMLNTCISDNLRDLNYPDIILALVNRLNQTLCKSTTALEINPTP